MRALRLPEAMMDCVDGCCSCATHRACPNLNATATLVATDRPSHCFTPRKTIALCINLLHTRPLRVAAAPVLSVSLARGTQLTWQDTRPRCQRAVPAYMHGCPNGIPASPCLGSLLQE